MDIADLFDEYFVSVCMSVLALIVSVCMSLYLIVFVQTGTTAAVGRAVPGGVCGHC